MTDEQFLEIKAIVVNKLNLELGDTLVVSVKSNKNIENSINSLKERFEQVFPFSQVVVIGMNQTDAIDFKVVRDNNSVGCSTENYCADCNCGKKEAAESKS